MLKGLDGVPHLRRIVPTGSGALLQDPTTRGTNTTTEFGVREDCLKVGINRLALLLQNFDVPCDLNPPLKQLIRVEVLQMGEGVFSFRRKGLEKVLQGTRG
jgi:hypothetical protein